MRGIRGHAVIASGDHGIDETAYTLLSSESDEGQRIRFDIP
jgi:hypothetical protein